MASMTVDQLIYEIEVYIDNCHTTGMLGGGNTIKVNREEILAMIDELKAQLPKEINEGRDIVRTQEMRIAKAKADAERIMSDAANQAAKLIDENEIVQMANMRAQHILEEAEAEAMAIVKEAKENSYNIQTGALQYTQNVLEGLETMYSSMVAQETDYFNAVLDKLKDDHKQIMDDKREIDIQLGNGFRSSRSKEDFEKKEEE